MHTTPDIERRRALMELVQRREAFDERRRHHLVLQGRPDRHQQLARLTATYVQAKLVELRDREALRELEG